MARVDGRSVGSASRWQHQAGEYQQESRVRKHVEHVFHVVKRLWHFAKVRYRGPAKNTARAMTTFALANLYLVRHNLASQGT